MTQKDNDVLQSDINNILKWAEINKLKLNVSKCQFMAYGRKSKCLADCQYNVNGQILTPVETITDLGVTFESNLSFKKHIAAIVLKAQKNLGLTIRACAHIKNITTFFALFNLYVRSILEYASVVWNCDGITGETKSLEKVQNRFLQFVYYKVHGIYPNYSSHPVKTDDLRREFNCPKLSFRRKCLDEIFLYKLLNNKIDHPDLVSSITIHVPPRATRSKGLFYIPIAKSKTYQNSPMVRLMSSHNITGSISPVDIFHDSEQKFRKALADAIDDF